MIRVMKAEVKDGVRVESFTFEPYPLRLTLCNILFHESQKVNAREAIARDRLCTAIEDAVGDTLLVEEADWKRLEQSVHGLPHVGRWDAQMVQRVLRAPAIKVGKVADEPEEALPDPDTLVEPRRDPHRPGRLS
jgi:hypothetical protein